MNNEIVGDFFLGCYLILLLMDVIRNNICEIEGSLVFGLMYYFENV